MFFVTYSDVKRIATLFPIKNPTKNGKGVTLSIPREPGKISIFLKGADQIKPHSNTPVVGWKASHDNWIKYQVKECDLDNPTLHDVKIEIIFKSSRINVYAGKKRIMRFSFNKYSDISLKNICRIANNIYDNEGNAVSFSENLWIKNGNIQRQ